MLRPRPIAVLDYRPEWVTAFEEERARLQSVFGVGADIEHIGSTSVPGLAAKPIVDICVGLRSLSQAEERVDALAALGYGYVPEYEVAIPDRRYFRKPFAGARTHHVHCVVKGHEIWVRHLLFRDFLRRHPDVAARYAELKRTLAVRHAGNRPAYTEGKDPFISGVLASAAAETRAAESSAE